VYYAERACSTQGRHFVAAVLASSVLYYALSRLISLDMPVSSCLTAALLSFLLGTQEQEKKHDAYSSGILRVRSPDTLTKGLIGIAFPGMIIFLWMLVTGEWRVLRTMHLLSGLRSF